MSLLICEWRRNEMEVSRITMERSENGPKRTLAMKVNAHAFRGVCPQPQHDDGSRIWSPSIQVGPKAVKKNEETLYMLGIDI